MKVLRVVPIVEGHGEVEAVRTLLDRVWRELADGDYIEVIQPVRVSRSKLLRPDRTGGRSRVEEKELRRAVILAARKLAQRSEPPCPAAILLILDADRDCPRELAPRLEEAARPHCGDFPVACVLANPEYETWFVAAAESLEAYLDLAATRSPEDPEAAGCGKRWIATRFRTSYSETADQPTLTAAMNLELCLKRSRSFRRLSRVLKEWADEPTPA